MSAQLALLGGNSASGGKVALAVLPGQVPLALLLDTPFLIVVLRVVSAALPVQFALEASCRAYIGLKFFAEWHQLRFSLLLHNGNGGGTHIQPDYARSDGMLRFLIGVAF